MTAVLLVNIGLVSSANWQRLQNLMKGNQIGRKNREGRDVF
jgi:hypothetical protein